MSEQREPLTTENKVWLFLIVYVLVIVGAAAIWTWLV